MSQVIGQLMVITSCVLYLALIAKLFVQPFIPEENFMHAYFPSTELVLGVPIFCGVIFFGGLAFYVMKELIKI